MLPNLVSNECLIPSILITSNTTFRTFSNRSHYFTDNPSNNKHTRTIQNIARNYLHTLIADIFYPVHNLLKSIHNYTDYPKPGRMPALYSRCVVLELSWPFHGEHDMQKDTLLDYSRAFDVFRSCHARHAIAYATIGLFWFAYMLSLSAVQMMSALWYLHRSLMKTWISTLSALVHTLSISRTNLIGMCSDFERVRNGKTEEPEL